MCTKHDWNDFSVRGNSMICTKCGSIVHDEDWPKHICTNPVQKGKEKVPTMTEKNV